MNHDIYMLNSQLMLEGIICLILEGDHETFSNNQRLKLSWVLVVGGASVLDSQFQLQ